MANTSDEADELWQWLERRVRQTASFIWDRPAQPRTINGVKVDCVLENESDLWTCIEISRSNTLEKIRTDLGKFQVVRPFLQGQGIVARCFFITEEEPPPSVVESAAGLHVKAMSVEKFAALFFDFPSYQTARLGKSFGSAVNPESGVSDETAYIPVKYRRQSGFQVSVDDVVAMLATGKKVVLLYYSCENK